jgi:hypothetical protein
VGWVERRDGVVGVVCVGSVRDGEMGEGDMGCVCELNVVGSGVAFGEW